jgi:hypothetical protein
MEQGILGATAGRQQPVQDRPGWWQSIGWTLLACLLASAFTLVIAIPCSFVSVDVTALSTGNWPRRPDSLWAACVWAMPIAVPALTFTLALRVVASSGETWRVRSLPVMAALTTLWAIGAGGGGPNDLGAQRLSGWTLVAMVLLARYVAVVPRSTAPRPVPRWIVAAMVAAGALVAAGAVTYRPFHPLHVQIGDEQIGSSVVWSVAADGKRDPRAVDFGLSNDSFAVARVIDVEPLTDGAAAVVVQVDNPAAEFTPETAWVAFPAGGLRLTPDATAMGRFRLAPGSCRVATGATATVRGAVFTVETLGMRREQRIMRDEPSVLACPR